MATKEYREGFLKLLRANPPWREDVLRRLASLSSDLPGLFLLFGQLQDGANALSASELQPVLTRLIAAGRVDQSYLLWKRSLPDGRLDAGPLLYNGKFQYASTNLPFDWQFENAPGFAVGVEADSGGSALNVDFVGSRVTSPFVSHLTALPAGKYRFSGGARARQLENPRGVRWRMTCLTSRPADPASDANALMETDLATGDRPWRDFAVAFTVPAANCRYQRLVLELPARVAIEREIRGGVSYVNLSIEKI